MAGKGYSTLSSKILAQTEAIAKTEKSKSMAVLHTQCACVHKDKNGSIALKVPNGGSGKSRWTGHPFYRCRLCNKELDLDPISQEEFDKALDIMNRVIDSAKMRLNLNNSENDEDMAIILAKIQYRMNRIMPDAFKAISKSAKKKGNGRSSSSIMRVSR